MCLYIAVYQHILHLKRLSSLGVRVTRCGLRGVMSGAGYALWVARSYEWCGVRVAKNSE